MRTSEVREVVFGYGHENIQATHKTTLEFTKDPHLTKKGDCIVTVAADKALADLSAEFKENLRKRHAKLSVLIEVDGVTEQVNAYGSPRLVLTHPTDMVIRKSDYACNRTLAIHADKAAQDLPREFVEKLKNPKQKVKITLEVHV
jgi:hypothetical protein